MPLSKLAQFRSDTMSAGWLLLAVGWMISSCTTAPPTAAPIVATAIPAHMIETDPIPTDETARNTIESDELVTATAFTHVRADGNRLITGQGNLLDLDAIDIQLDGTPIWINGLPTDSGILWAVALDTGTINFYQVSGTQATKVDTAQLAPKAAFILLQSESGFHAAKTLDTGDSLVYKVPVSDNTTIPAALSPGQAAQFGATPVQLSANMPQPLPDARILSDSQGQFLYLSLPTDRYRHGVLGDSIEAGGITLLDVNAEPAVVTHIEIPAPRVIEGIMPIWTDLDGDGQREIIVTLSDGENGAQLVVYNSEGEKVAASSAIGQGNRWRNQLAVGPFGPNGEMELVDVRTPHLSGTIEFFRLNGDLLERVAATAGYTTHVIGSRNLDLGVAGDFAGLGRAQILLPTLDRRALALISRDETSNNGTTELWRASLPSSLSSNVATTHAPDGRLAVAIGLSDGRLRVWQP